MSIRRNYFQKGVSKTRMAILAAVAAAIVAVSLWGLNMLKRPVVDLHGSDTELLYIPTGSNFSDVCQLLQVKGWLTDADNFSLIASLMSYTDNVKSGRYRITHGATARQLVALLRSGRQEAVNVTFNNLRTIPQLAGAVSRYLECDSAEYLSAMSDTALLSKYGFNVNTSLALFLPNTYQFMWNTSGTEWVERMHNEYARFWNPTRRAKADSLNLTPVGVSTIASIIEEESNKVDEWPIIAGLYINRLRIGMPMQACPTIKYALGDFGRRRILAEDQKVESPYNTYKYAGLPPGPIRIPSIKAIDAVLAAGKHDYLYMCAKPDGSGYHDFARTLAQHARNAKEYQRQLNKRKIYR